MNNKQLLDIEVLPEQSWAEIAQPGEATEEELASEDKVKNLMKWFENNNISYDKFDPESIPKVNFDKKSYPNYDEYMNVPGQHDTSKWLQAVKELYYKEKNGLNRVNAIRQVTSGWKVTETFDFLNWLRFYQEGAHLKYKTASLWYENGDPGYFLHVKKDTVAPEQNINFDIGQAKDSPASEMSSKERKDIIEKQRYKIVGRLDSAEKLLRSQEGQLFAGKELESLMESIYDLKKKIQLVNKLSVSTRLYEDMIVREANSLTRKGFYKAAEVLHKMAQTPEQTAESAKGKDEGGKAPSVAPPAPPAEPSGSLGGLPSTGPGMAQTPPESAPNDNSVIPAASPPPVEKTTQPKGIAEFLKGMETGKITTLKDDQNLDDSLEVVDGDEDLVVSAQAVPPEAMEDIPLTTHPRATKPKALPEMAPEIKTDKLKPNMEESLEVSENDLKPQSSSTIKDFDKMIDSTFANVTIEDVVAKLEDLAKIFRTREIPRQLAIIDMMLNSLGLSSLFSELSEAQNKALESTNYISTRLDLISGQLRGAMKTRKIDLKGDESSPPEVENIKKNLSIQEQKEKDRKQMRKDQENEELANKSKEKPEVEIEEDLKAPATAPMAPPVKV